MKKSFILIFSVCLLAFHSFSQQNLVQESRLEKGYLSLSSGGAIPVGKYGSKNGQDQQSGIANPGGLIDLSYILPIRNNPFGFKVSLRGRFNPIDAAADIAPLAAGNPGYQWSEGKASWETAALMVGIYYHCSVAKRWEFNASALTGAADSKLPAYTVMGIKTDADPSREGFVQLSTSKASAVSFSELIGAGLSYRLARQFSLLANIGFWGLVPTFKNETVRETLVNGLNVPNLFTLSNSLNPIVAYDHTFNYGQPMNSIDLSVGIAMRL